jgi:hypothetical protein
MVFGKSLARSFPTVNVIEAEVPRAQRRAGCPPAAIRRTTASDSSIGRPEGLTFC